MRKHCTYEYKLLNIYSVVRNRAPIRKIRQYKLKVLVCTINEINSFLVSIHGTWLIVYSRGAWIWNMDYFSEHFVSEVRWRCYIQARYRAYTLFNDPTCKLSESGKILKGYYQLRDSGALFLLPFATFYDTIHVYTYLYQRFMCFELINVGYNV